MDFAIKNSIFANLQCFLADSKSRAQELSNDVSFVIFGHKTWDLEGGGVKYPRRDRVKRIFNFKISHGQRRALQLVINKEFVTSNYHLEDFFREWGDRFILCT